MHIAEYLCLRMKNVISSFVIISVFTGMFSVNSNLSQIYESVMVYLKNGDLGLTVLRKCFMQYWEV